MWQEGAESTEVSLPAQARLRVPFRQGDEPPTMGDVSITFHLLAKKCQRSSLRSQ